MGEVKTLNCLKGVLQLYENPHNFFNISDFCYRSLPSLHPPQRLKLKTETYSGISIKHILSF